MSIVPAQPGSKPAKVKQRPFRRAVLRGLGVVLPPLLTIVILVWVWNTVQDYVLVHVESAARQVIVWSIAEIHETVPGGGRPSQTVRHNDVVYVRLGDDRYVPRYVVERVRKNLHTEPMPDTAKGVYQRYVDICYLHPSVVIPVFLCLFILLLYLLGKFLAAGVGRMLWNAFEQIIHRLPLIRNVYSSVKQVTDFVFSEREIEFRRVVAVQYPRKGIWSIGFVTGESMLDIQAVANEPVLSVLIPTSPMPVTGFTVTVRKSEAVDLEMTIDQAIQFIVSCGVVVPPQQLHADVSAETAAQTAGSGQISNGGSGQPVLASPTAEQPAKE